MAIFHPTVKKQERNKEPRKNILDPQGIIFQFQTGFIAPSSRVLRELVDDPFAIAKRYLLTYFIVDILSVLPLPQSGDNHDHVKALLNVSCSSIGSDKDVFDFGMYTDAIKSGVVESTHFHSKILYCFWWGLRNFSSLGQSLKTSIFIGEIFFAVFGLIFFSLLIGNIQKYLQSTTVRVEKMRMKRQEVEIWMSHRMIQEPLRERIRKYEQYKWQETRGVEEDTLLQTLPKDLRRDIKRHLCLELLRRVPMFEKMDQHLLDTLCDRLKSALYTNKMGDPVDEMLFILRGSLATMTKNGFFNTADLKAGDFCGEELLTWALDPNSASKLPTSTRTVEAKTEVEAFVLMADDLKLVASQFSRLHRKQLQHIFRQGF
ncbi:hypothetical protein F8388_003885 [Cannabis sativa]|uniref:Cyclic nucleotide-binding domain-containing protein n=1 Tax=Cannabis sativa TaxID=3483 RepID=A0A7J6GP90_CANSA|nr:hypothetical protein F8388_003885 [Cannabis sativa]